VFLKSPGISKKRDAIQYWGSHKAKFPLLVVVAASVLGAVASSAVSERDFSLAGNIMRKSRAPLLPRHLAMHFLIHDNVDLLPANLDDVPRLTMDEEKKARADMTSGGSSEDQEDDTDGSDNEEL